MNFYPLASEYSNKPFRLSAEEQANPRLVIQQFLRRFSLQEVRQNLWLLTETALTTEDSHYDTAFARDAALRFYHEAEKLFEAVWEMEKELC